MTQKSTKQGMIKPIKATDVPDERSPLPPGFYWEELDIMDDAAMDEVVDFMNNHFVEDERGLFTINYNREKLRWGIGIPGYWKELHLTVRSEKNKKIMGLSLNYPKKYMIFGQQHKCTEGNIYAVHKALRQKRLAGILIGEALRVSRKKGAQISMYTSPHAIPTPVTTIHTYNRFINATRLCECMYTLPP